MNQLYALIAFVLTSTITMAGTTSTFEQRQAKVKKAMEINQHRMQTANKTNAVVYRNTGYRHDKYNLSVASWRNHDSIQKLFNILAVDSQEIDYVYDTTAASWGNSGKVIYTFGSNGLLSTQLNQIWVASPAGWRNSQQTVYNFNQQNLVDNYYDQNWDTATQQWVNGGKELYTYAAGPLLLTDTYQKWDSAGNKWLNVYNMVRTYDANHNNLTYTYQNWDTTGNQWVNANGTITTYDANNNATLSYNLIWNTGTSAWDTTYKTTTTFTNNIKTVDLVEKWITSSASWRKQSLFTYGYTGTNMTSNIQQNWDTISSSWINYASNFFVFNSDNNKVLEVDSNWDAGNAKFYPAYRYEIDFTNGNETRYEVFYWNGSISALGPMYRNTYQYDVNNNNTYHLYERYNGTSYDLADQFFYYYTAYTVTDIEETESIKGLGIFPNPASGSEVYARFTLLQDASVTINTYDNNGRLISSVTNNFPSGENMTQLNVNQLSTGVYHIQYVNNKDNSSASLKLVVK